MSLRTQLNDKLVTLIDIYPEYISLITQQMANIAEIPNMVYSQYKDVLFEIDGMKSKYSTKKRYISYDTLSTDDIKKMLESVNELIERMNKIQKITELNCKFDVKDNILI